jgi:hypothetical protein
LIRKLLLFSVFFLYSIAASAQTKSLLWDEPSSPPVTGYSVTIDGVRTDYHLTPVPASGTCGCSLPLPFSGGRHTLVVGAYNSSGETLSAALVVAPLANAGGPYAGQAGTAVAVNASGSTDPTGTITAYAWNWGDGTSTQVTSAQTSHTYASAGTYTMTLTITDNAGATAAATAAATIASVAPSSPPSAPSSPAPSSGATNVTTFPAVPTLTWSATGAASYTVRFGNGNPPPQVATGVTSASFAPQSIAAGTTYFWQIVATNAAGSTTGPVWSFATSGSSGGSGTLSPYSGTPAPVPGQINAEKFDNGGEGIGYHDTSAGNTGGQFRSTDVDVENSAEGGFDVGWIGAGEWLNYTVNVTAAGSYTVQLRVASPSGASLHVGFNGPSAGQWKAVSVPATGGWQNWTTVNVPVTLGAGVQQMTLQFDTGGMNLRYVTAALAGAGGGSSGGGGTPGTLSPYSGTPAPVPGQINAEKFDNGGEGIGYHDTSAGNTGGQFRSTDVDVENSAEGGFDVGWIGAGEWLNYTVNVTAAGSYTVQLRVASPSGASLHVGFNGPSAGQWKTVSVPATGGWQNWTTVNVPVTLGAGVQQMTLQFDTGGLNVRYAIVGH